MNTVGRDNAVARLVRLLADAAAPAAVGAAPPNEGAALVPPKPVANIEVPPKGLLCVVVVLAPNPPNEKPVLPAVVVVGAPNENVGAVVVVPKAPPKLKVDAGWVACVPNPNPVPVAAG